MKAGLVVEAVVATIGAGLVVLAGVTTTRSINSGLITSMGMTSLGTVTANAVDETSDVRLKKISNQLTMGQISMEKR